MERRTSPIAIGLAVAAILGVLLAGYVNAYWWRLGGMPIREVEQGQRVVVTFHTRFETKLFAPAVWLHQRVHWESFRSRSNVIVHPVPMPEIRFDRIYSYPR